MGFIQTIAIRSSNIAAVRDLLVDWHTSQAGAPGARALVLPKFSLMP